MKTFRFEISRWAGPVSRQARNRMVVVEAPNAGLATARLLRMYGALPQQWSRCQMANFSEGYRRMESWETDFEPRVES
jgi:hypothetical protein